MIEECNERGNKKIFVAKEKSKTFVIQNTSKVYINKVRVDNCYIKDDGKKCDYLFEIMDKNKIIYVELKGNKLEDAIKQLETTIYHRKIKELHKKFIKECYIIVSKVKRTRAKDASKSSNVKFEFKRKHNISLFVSTNKKEIII